MTGWTSLIMSLLFLSSCTLFFISIIGLYVDKIFQEVLPRPRFLIDQTINFSHEQPESIKKQKDGVYEEKCL